MEKTFDAFISYGRADSKAFATKIYEQLTAKGFKVWFDQNDIPLAVDFQEQINDGIEKAHNFIFIIAPHSVNSEYCLKEINLAVKYNKRIIPLLHVERITQEIYQQRNPNKTEKDWQKHQAKGLHLTYGNPKMHEIICKINSLNFGENEDIFDSKLKKLVATIHENKDYVEQHTNYLIQGLEWTINQQQTNYLLVGEERKKATNWLLKKFEELPPCTPSDIHCEFISESIKNANNLMTDVFLAYAEQDEDIKEKIRKSLMRESLTVWTNKTDIKTGITFQEAINQGVEEADNFVYLISPHSIESEYCQQELAHAFANNKRIIPLLIQEIELDSIPSQVRELQFIDFTAYQQEEKYQESITQLLKELKQDSHYYEKHKSLLVKALKWQRQNYNSSLLLRGYNLQHFEAWLKTAQIRNEHPSIPLQEKFINASLKQPEKASLEVFISYSRTDSDLARKLNDRLQELGKTTWFDQENIATGTDFQQEIYRGIESSDHFLFIISPKSINSPYCADEVEYAQKLGKRFVTILHRPLSAKDKQKLHPTLKSIEWLNFNQHGGEFAANFNELVRTLDTDRDHVRSHTEWSQKALKWQQMEQDEALLLRGSELNIAKNWLSEAQKNNKQPAATELQQQFIGASQELSDRLLKEKKQRKRNETIAVVAAFFLLTSFSIFAGFQWRKATISQIEALRQSTQLNRQSNQDIEALLDYLKIVKLLNSGLLKLFKPHEELKNLRQAIPKVVYTTREFNRLETDGLPVHTVDFQSIVDSEMIITQDTRGISLWHLDGKLKQKYTWKEVDAILEQSDGNLYQTLKEKYLLPVFSFSPDGKMLAQYNEHGKVFVLNNDGTLHKTFQASNRMITEIKFSPDSRIIATASWDSEVKLWNLDGTLSKKLQGHSESVNGLDFSSDGEIIATASNDKTVKLWNLDGSLLKTLKGHQAEVWGVSISPDSQMIATASNDGTVKLWNRKGTLLKTFEGHQNVVRAVGFSRDGKVLASAGDDGTVKLWQLPGTPLTRLNHTLDEVHTVSFSPDSQKLATTRGHGHATFWDKDGMKLETKQKHYGPISILKFSPDGKLIVSAAGDRSVRVSLADGSSSFLLEGHIGEVTQQEVLAVSFSPNSQIFVLGDIKGKIKIWGRDRTLQKTVEGHNGRIWEVSFSSDGEVFASGSDDGTVKLWNRDGSFNRTILEHDHRVFGVAFSPEQNRNKQIIAVAVANGTVKLFNRDGIEIKTFQAHDRIVSAVAFSPNGELIGTVGYDKTVKLWNRDGTLHKTFYGHDDDVKTLAFSPDGKTLASVSKDNTVNLWNLDAGLDLDSLSEYTCDWLRNYLEHHPNLKEEERKLCDGIGEEK
ncbi:TIR domain-containing protein [Crocosphaera sp.]|uniref:TIR domain-containing protein n=1 Tax=Crocosphaera sp. TaxID=2729996 RepID=UPI0026351E8B|nr:TIR domain-containing protein [Crocosphaera sp.]MDJ0580823.1 TIR domain-containing protein [Crocosphaera sp.]